MDVAKKAGVDFTTVSQVLNDRDNCWASQATRKRIREAATDLGYRPNRIARALQSGRSHIIGLVSPGFATGSPHSRAGGLTEAAAKSDYTVTLTSHANDSESEDLVIRRLLDCGVDGLAIYPVDGGSHYELRRLVACGFPVVTFEGANLLDFPCDDISVEWDAVGRIQARHLLRLGRRRVCLANAIPDARINAIREATVRRELAHAGAPPPLEMHLRQSATREIQDVETLEAPMRTFLKEHRGAFDGVIGFDLMASLAIRLLHELELRVPEDVVVVGAGNTTLASYGAVPLTSISMADDMAGAKAFGLLLNRIRGHRNGQYKRLVSPARLVVRNCDK